MMSEYTNASTQTTPNGDEAAAEEQIEEQTDAALTKKERDNSWMLSNANGKQVVLHMTPNDIQQSTNQVTSKEASELLCSYSWKQTETPTIYVPGSPSRFLQPTFDTMGDENGTERIKGIQLPSDTGLHWIDQHAERVPQHQFEPVFQALSVMNPSVRFDNVDIVVNRSSLQLLLRLLKNQSTQAFHLDLDVVGKTLFIGRKLKKAKGTSQEASYGRSFEEYFTTEDPLLEDAQGHHRVPRYDFGGLDMVVRIKTNAFISDLKYNPDAPVVLQPPYHSTTTLKPGIFHRSPHPTIVVAKGTVVPHAQTVELKSNDKTKPKEQMWFGRTPLCCFGAHKNGLFTRANVKMFHQKEVEEWEDKCQVGLRKLA
jgi:hypothetical protein